MRTQRCLANLHDLRVTVGKIERDGNLMLAVENIQKSSIEHIVSLETARRARRPAIDRNSFMQQFEEKFLSKRGVQGRHGENIVK